MDRSDVGLVYSSTTGLEMALAGKPVVVAGRRTIGARASPSTSSSAEEFRSALDGILDDPTTMRPDVDRALRYAHFFFFRAPIRAPFVVEPIPGLARLTTDNLADLEPGNNADLDRICDRHPRGSLVRRLTARYRRRRRTSPELAQLGRLDRGPEGDHGGGRRYRRRWRGRASARSPRGRAVTHPAAAAKARAGQQRRARAPPADEPAPGHARLPQHRPQEGRREDGHAQEGPVEGADGAERPHQRHARQHVHHDRHQGRAQGRACAWPIPWSMLEPMARGADVAT